MSTIIEARSLTYTYGVGTPFEHTALDNVSFRIEEGEFVGIIGHTGSGKSTLVQMLNGLVTPSSGEVYFRDKNIHDKDYKLRDMRFKVGLVFQYPEYQLFEETVYRDIAFGPKNMGLSESEIDDRVREAARFTGIREEQLEKSPFELSGGQKRRVAIAGVLAMRPEVLILDEPTSGLDPRGRERILELIKSYHRERGTTVLFVTHSMEDIARTVERLIVLNESKLVLDDIPENVFLKADFLDSIGLDVPQITKVFMLLSEKYGINIPTSVYTVKYAKKIVDELMAKGEIK
ncbi:MAG: energy-coupling factor transporter ATPase [Clostridiales bacterium]|nr:energy-coupling factor transporter ATPase [Clostridiales bacterium]